MSAFQEKQAFFYVPEDEWSFRQHKYGEFPQKRFHNSDMRLWTKLENRQAAAASQGRELVRRNMRRQEEQSEEE